MQIENGIGDRVDIDGVEELDGLPHEVGLTDQQVELGQCDYQVGNSFPTHAKISILVVILVAIVIEDNRHQLSAVGEEGNAVVGDGHVRILFRIKNPQSWAGGCQHCQQLIRATVGDLEFGEEVEAAHKVEQLSLDARLALDVKEEVEDGQSSQLVSLVKHQEQALACDLMKEFYIGEGEDVLQKECGVPTTYLKSAKRRVKKNFNA